MLPKIELFADVDVSAMSPLPRGMIMTISSANAEGGIGLTASGAMNRKFVHWAAVHFDWPGYTEVVRIFGQGVKWNFCLTAGTMGPRIRRDYEQTYAPESHTGL